MLHTRAYACVTLHMPTCKRGSTTPDTGTCPHANAHTHIMHMHTLDAHAHARSKPAATHIRARPAAPAAATTRVKNMLGRGAQEKNGNTTALITLSHATTAGLVVRSRKCALACVHICWWVTLGSFCGLALLTGQQQQQYILVLGSTQQAACNAAHRAQGRLNRQVALAGIGASCGAQGAGHLLTD